MKKEYKEDEITIAFSVHFLTAQLIRYDDEILSTIIIQEG